MALYDVEGDVKFAQTQIDTSRAYKEKQAKKQESFSKKLQGVNILAKGANYLINQRADALEQNQSFKKASYETMMKRAEAVRLQDAERLKTGTSQLDYLTNNIYTKLIDQIETDMPLADINLAKVAFRKEAQTLAKTKLPSYKEMIDTANNFGSFEDFEKDYGKASGIPRSIFGFMTSGVKNIVRGETPESIAYKAEKEKDALYGTDLFNKFENLEKSFKAYDASTNSSLNVAEILEKAEKDSLIKGQIFTPGVKIVNNSTEDRGVITTVSTLLVPRRDYKTGEIVSNKNTNITLDTSVKRTKDGYIDSDAIQKILDQVKPESQQELSDIIYKGGDPSIENADAAIQWMARNPAMMAINWTDQNNKAKAFPVWYSNKVKYAGFVNDKGKFISISRPTATKGIFEIDPAYKDKAVELGYDESSAYDTFAKMGDAALVGVSSYANANDAVTLGNLIDDKYQDITTGLTQPQAKAYNAVQQTDWYTVFQKQIDAGKGAYEKDPSKRMTLLSDSLDLSMIFPSLDFLSGEYSIYRDNETTNILIKSK